MSHQPQTVSQGQPMTASINPANGETIAEYAFLAPAEVDTVLDRASRAFAATRIGMMDARAALLHRIADGLAAHRDALAMLITVEMGKPIGEALAEVDKCAMSCRYYADHGAAYLAPEAIRSDVHATHVTYDPLGPILAIMPWNFPYWQVIRFLAPAIMAGNTVVLKHAENVQGCAQALVDVALEAGAEPGLLQNLLVAREDVAGVIADDRIAAVTFTGSVPAGRIVAGHAGAAGKKSVLELGGSDPFIVLPDADLDAAVATAVTARFMNAGQSCICAKRFIIHDAVHDAFVERFVAGVQTLAIGDPTDHATRLGPLARADLRDMVAGQLAQTERKGARVALAGGPQERPGWFFAPAIVTDVPDDAPSACDEVFGPVAAVFRVRSDDEAVARANNTRFGLGASIWTADLDRAAALAPRIEAGAVFVNDLVRSAPNTPFGGIKDSGYGRELGQVGAREFTNHKLVWINAPG